MKSIQFFFHILFVLLISNCSNNNTITSAKDFAKEFYENNPGFYANHFNKTITLKGKIIKIGQSIGPPENYFVKLEGYKSANGLVNVFCYFSSIDQIKNLKLGEVLLIGGICRLSNECYYSRCYPAIGQCKILDKEEKYKPLASPIKKQKSVEKQALAIKPYVKLYEALKANGVKKLPNTLDEFKSLLLKSDKSVISATSIASKLRLNVGEFNTENVNTLREQLGLTEIKPYEKLYQDLKANGVKGLPNSIDAFKAGLLKSDEALLSTVGAARKLQLDVSHYDIENLNLLREQLGLTEKNSLVH